MRLNVYAEELTDRVELVEKEVEGTTFYGIRLYLWFPDQGPFIHREGDDDSSAVTFWVPWTRKDGSNTKPLEKIVNAMQLLIDEINGT